MQRHRRAETPGTAGAGWPAGGVANLECQVEGSALLQGQWGALAGISVGQTVTERDGRDRAAGTCGPSLTRSKGWLRKGARGCRGSPCWNGGGARMDEHSSWPIQRGC